MKIILLLIFFTIIEILFVVDAYSQIFVIYGRLIDNYGNSLQAHIFANSICNTTDENGNYQLFVDSGIYDLEYNISNFPISNFSIKILFLNVTSNIKDVMNNLTDYGSQSRLSFVVDVNKSQLVQTRSYIKPNEVKIRGTEATEVNSLSQLGNNSWFYDSAEQKLYILATYYELPVKKFVIVWEGALSEDNLKFIAQNFDLMDTGFGDHVANIKSFNPNLIIIGYRDVMAMYPFYPDWVDVDSHENWFLHDINGNRLQRPPWNWYAMDVGSNGWRNHFADMVINETATFPFFDGLFADDVWPIFPTSGWLNDSVPNPRIEPSWHKDMTNFLSFLKNAMGEKLVVPNAAYDQYYVNATDGAMYEGFCHSSWENSSSFAGEDIILLQINLLSNISRQGKIFLTLSGTNISDNATQGELQKSHDTMLYCFSGFLLGWNDENSYFGWNDFSSKDGSHGYYHEMDYARQLGYPITDYYRIDNQPVYARDFDYGKVLMNPTSNDGIAIDLNRNYRTSSGEIVSKIILNSHSGEILLKV